MSATRDIAAMALGAIVVLLCGPPAGAQEPVGDSVTAPESCPVAGYPDSPVGRRLCWAILTTQPGARIEPSRVFTPEFLKAIPPDEVIRAIRETAEESGGLELIEIPRLDSTRLEAVARTHADSAWWRVEVTVEPTPPYGIVRLYYAPAPELGAPDLADWSAFDSLLALFQGETAVAVFAVGEADELRPIHRTSAGDELAIGSTFKLFVLGALAESIEAGDASWDERLAIREEWKSLPSGRMQNLEPGEERTLREYALQMISVSDNTATDHLMHRIGRINVEAFAARLGSGPDRNEPFLTTRELFQLKIAASPELRERFIHASVEERRALLTDSVAPLPLPPGSDLPARPTAIGDIEYFASPDELCRLIVELMRMADRPGLEPIHEILTRNPGFRWDREAWREVAYKGGSEPGVVNLTWLLVRANGERFALSMTVNDAVRALDPDRIRVTIGAAQKLLQRERTTP